MALPNFSGLGFRLEVNYYKLQSFYALNAPRQFPRALACLGLAAILGGVTGFSMYFLGFGLAKIAMASAGVTAGISAIGLRIFTKYLHPWVKKAKPHQIEDKLLPNPEKTAKCKLLIDKLYQSKDASIKDIKATFKELFELRAYINISDQVLKDNAAKMDDEFEVLFKRVKSESDWNKPEIRKDLKMIAINQVLFTHMFLARIEMNIREANEKITPENISRRLVVQPLTVPKFWKNPPKDLKIYQGMFLDNGIINFYHMARSKTWLNEKNEVSNPRDWVAAAKSAYEKGQELNDCRKIYNVFVKHGFFARYGNEKLRDQLRKDDSRFDLYTRRDSTKLRGVDSDDGGFTPNPY